MFVLSAIRTRMLSCAKSLVSIDRPAATIVQAQETAHAEPNLVLLGEECEQHERSLAERQKLGER